MMIGDYSKMFAATFSGQVLVRLQQPHESGRFKRKTVNVESIEWYVSGYWLLKAHGEDGRVKVRIRVYVGEDWMLNPPAVKVHEEFMRKDIDWHRYSDGGLCYVLKEEWRDRLERIFERSKGDMAYTMDYAATWLLAATDSLVTRHLIGHRHNIGKWPDEWQAYSHYDVGAEEYRRERSKFCK